MNRTPWLLIFAALCALTVLVLYFTTGAPPLRLEPIPEALRSDYIKRGEYLTRLAGCGNCHTDAPHGGRPFAGGREFKTQFGVFYAPNITPDAETGIGRWTEGQFAQALHFGLGPGRKPYFPAFPYTAYARMTTDDVRAIYAYLQTVQPVRQESRPHDLPFYLPQIAAKAWQVLFFAPPREEATRDREAVTPLDRGEYLANAVAHCGECHTPRNRLGALDNRRFYAGVPKGEGPDGKASPNITSSRKSGIGKWSAGDLRQFLRTGQLPDGDYVGGAMVDVIDNGLKYLTDDDLKALVLYLRSVPPID